MTRALHRAVAVLAVVALLPGCSITAPQRASLMHAGTGGYCVSLEAAGGRPRATADDEAVEEVVRAGSDPVGGLSRTAAEIATIIGAGGLINRMDALEAQARRTGSPADAVLLLRLEQQVTQRVLRTMLDVAAVLANLDCENERGDQLRDLLLKLEEQWSRRMSQASIMIGGTTVVVSGLIALLHPAAATGAVAGIIGGTVEAGTAFVSLSGTAQGHLATEPNVLGEVWDGPARPVLFPPSVWRYLNRPLPGQADGATRRRSLLERWRAEAGGGASPVVTDGQIALIMGRGGQYTVDDLGARDTLLDLLGASIATMNQQLQVLLDELAARGASWH